MDIVVGQTVSGAFLISGDRVKGWSRLDRIMDYLKSHNLVTVDELLAVIDASPATIRRVLLADSSKYGAYSLFCVTPLTALTDIVTDRALAPETQQLLHAPPVQLHLV